MKLWILSAFVGEFDAGVFAANFEAIRKFTCESPSVPENEGPVCRGGVIYKLVPELPGLGVSGVMRRWCHGCPLILQLLLFKTNDSYHHSVARRRREPSV